MNKGTKTKAGAAGPGITDIPHEEVKHSENGVSIAAKVITPEDQIKIEIQKFNLAESGIAALKETYGALVINGPEDKVGYKAVREAWREVQSKRTGLEKKGLELRNGYGVITKGIKKEEDRLVDLITPLEDDLYKKWKDIDAEKERIEKEAEAEEQRQMMLRVEEVLGLGMVFNGGFYCVGDDISMDVATLRALPLDQYEKLKDKIVLKVTEIAEAKAAELEKQRIEAERLQKEKDELARQQRELQEQQAEMNRQKEEMATQQREVIKQKLENRVNRLKSMGFKFRGPTDSFVYDNGFGTVEKDSDTLMKMDDYGFDENLLILLSLVEEIDSKKSDHEEQVNQEKAEKSRREKNIAGHMDRIGMVYNYQHSRYEFINEVLTLTADWNILLPMDDDTVKEFAIDAGASILAAKSQVEKLEKQRKDAAEKEAKLAMTEKERFSNAVLFVRNKVDEYFDEQDYKTAKYKKIVSAVHSRLTDLLKEAE